MKRPGGGQSRDGRTRARGSSHGRIGRGGRRAPDEWPPVARRVREARERLGLGEADIAARLGIEVSEYWDIEFHDDEAFTCFSVAQLGRLAVILEAALDVLLFGNPAEGPTTPTSFA